MIENQYLIYACYKISQKDSREDIIYKAAGKAYLDFQRRVSFQGQVSAEQRFKLKRAIKDLLVAELPLLFQVGSQEEFDEKHHEICNHIIRIYASIREQAYGIAQRWVNQTLLSLAVIECNLHLKYWKIEESRRYFHIPVEQYVLEAASTKSKTRFKHGLNLMIAPSKHDNKKDYEMVWYFHEKIQPVEFWEYQEYMDFQNTVRKRLQEFFPHTYRDCLSWAICAYLEVVQMRMSEEETISNMKEGNIR